MKKMISLTVMIVVICFTTIAKPVAQKGDTQCALGKYKVEKASDPVVIDDVELETFLITYENSDKKVKVAIDKDKKNKKFLVFSDGPSVQYICNKSYFGVEKLDKKYKKNGNMANDELLDRSAYFYQKILTRSDPDDRDCLGLIAVYYPRLINDYEDFFASK